MAIEPAYEDGVVGRDGVDPLATRERLTRPQRVIPVAAQDPLPGLQRHGVLLEPADKLLRGGGVPQVDRGQLEPAADEMRVAVGEAGKHEPPTGVDSLGAG